MFKKKETRYVFLANTERATDEQVGGVMGESELHFFSYGKIAISFPIYRKKRFSGRNSTGHYVLLTILVECF